MPADDNDFWMSDSAPKYPFQVFADLSHIAEKYGIGAETYATLLTAMAEVCRKKTTPKHGAARN